MLLPPSSIEDTLEDTKNATGIDTAEDTVEDNKNDTADNTGKKTVDDTAKGPSVSESEKSSETVDQFISRLGLNRDEAEVVEDLLKTHDFLKEKDLIESVIRAARD